MTSQCRTVFCCGAAFLLLLGCAFVLKPGAVWITDNGNKYIMMRNFAKGEGTVIKHVFPELFPTGGFHFIKVPGGAVSFYFEYLSFITVPFYKLFGERGTLVFPLLATLLLRQMAGSSEIRRRFSWGGSASMGLSMERARSLSG